MFNLASEALQAKLTIGMWTGRSRCRELSEEAAARYQSMVDEVIQQAVKDGKPQEEIEALEKVKVNPKRIESHVLTLRSEIRKQIQRISDKSRQYFNENTYMWDLGSWRLLPTKKFTEVSAHLQDQKTKFTEAVENTIISQYDEILAAAKAELGPIFEKIGFPDKKNLKTRYRFALETRPVSDPEDLRIKHIDTASVAALKKNIAERYGENLREAVRAQVDTMAKDIRYVADRMKSDTGFKDGMLSNKMKHVQSIRDLNAAMLNDAAVEAMANDAITMLGEWDPAIIKSDREARKEAASQFDRLATAIESASVGDNGVVDPTGDSGDDDPEEAGEMNDLL